VSRLLAEWQSEISLGSRSLRVGKGNFAGAAARDKIMEWLWGDARGAA
jgi:hypothetical protein